MHRIFIITLTVLSAHLSAQRGAILGTVTDQQSGTAIPYATVVLIADDEPTNMGAVSNEQGVFRVINIRQGTYSIVTTFIGYASDTIPGVAVSGERDVLDLGEIRLVPVQIALDGAEVTAMASTSTGGIERTTYRAEDFETAQGGNAVDLLKRLPSVNVSPDGLVQVRGTEDFLVYLNGKPTRMDPSVLLAQISSDQVERIELITVPSARYEAGGKGGIINLVTTTSGLEGLTVTMDLNGGGAPWGHKTDRYSGYEMNDYRYNGNLGLVYTADRLNLFGSLNYSMKNVNGRREGDAWILIPGSDSYKHMVAAGERPEWYENFFLNGGFDFQLTEHSAISGSYYFGQRNEGRSAFYVYHVFYADENKNPLPSTPLNESWIYNPNTDNRYGIFHSANLDYSLDMQGAGKLDISFLYENSGLSRELDNYDYFYNSGSDDYGAMLEHYNQTDDTPLEGFRLSVDYSKELENGHVLEAGFQPQLLHIGGSFSYDTANLVSGELGDYSSLDNTIDLTRNIYAGYLMYSGSVGKLEFSAGVRTELLDQDFHINNPDYFNIFERGARSDFHVDSINFFPTLQLGYSLGDDRLHFAASRRNSQPPLKNMAPFLYRRHLEVYVVGDPALQPEYATIAELTYDKKLGRSNVALTGFYRGVDNAVFRVNTVYDQEVVLIRSYTNSGTTRALGAEMNANIVAGAMSKLFLGGSLYNFRVQGDVFGYSEDNQSVNWSLKGAYNLNFTKQWKWAVDFDMQSATVTAQGRNEMFYFLNTAFVYSPAKLSGWQFSLRGLDLLSSNIKGLDTRAYDQDKVELFYQETTYYRYGPIVELSLSYSFNSTDRKAKGAMNEFGREQF